MKEVNYAPEGWHTLTPRIVVQNSRQFVEFLKQVFAGEGDYLEDRPAVIKIGDSLLMISEAGIRSTNTAFLYVYVRDTDATYQRALDAGARSLEQPIKTPYGDRRAMVEDRWGNIWQIATYMGQRD
jgi:PhnB protein